MLCDSIESFFGALGADRRILGLDFGEKKFGLAVSDSTGTIAMPHSVYLRRNARQDLGELNAILKREGICAAVVGLPLQLDGMEGEMCAVVRSFVQKLIKKSGVYVYLHDERFTTAMAIRTTESLGLRRKASQKVDDKISAALILQQVLDMAKGRGII
ncbi:Holliday junction resolvase RuvX [Anaplasma marginale]|uniref:Holliday junction resolvase RuvX n=1 Tax=Anaplasma marginale TaxID=770 RepID=UPI0004103575|nr:Holliday junction resolvase RuvX [Anaplasma marginale]AXW84562.1 Holliday junction resolvase RuvX [Anaplasma marginale]AXW85495.1 Holliday junction resolvase RuvX [Anaplasma marginale]KAA8472236.1 Holliday junction resolvase RuvX [Anaplasma marginale]KAB0450507.1 Holliday junction resolvase RuvX [Anaplasma marginale]RCL19428.1 Holliday junction resolvase RuvX [Anaplasma marginale]